MKEVKVIAHSGSNTKYTCPMKCEGTKVYDKPGDCPVCNMHLVPVDGNNKQDKHLHNAAHPSHTIVTDTSPKKEVSFTKSNTVYTCPMHPEIKRNKPGSCPICGMDLVPENPQDSSEEETAYRKMAMKFWIALVLTVPVFIIGMSDLFHSLHIDSVVSKRVLGWVELLLSSQ